ncbi:hypothetical protein B0H19DRAFT_1271681 [Mycena capillaripes]|nr:hypothetical protein B0H19DRAFT_1271681 [Mycena capillaripes]
MTSVPMFAPCVKLQKTLVALDILANGSHQLATAAKDDNHLTTIFVILPLFTDFAEISVQAIHQTATSTMKLPGDLSQSVTAIGVFAGISDARVHVAGAGNVICLTYYMYVVASSGPFLVPELQYLSGALPPLRDAFRTWSYRLKIGADAPALMLWFLRGRPDSAEDLRGDDATLLCHRAPLVKAYGFNIYLGRLVHTMESEEQEIHHPYKKYFESVEEIKRSRLVMSENPEVSYEWKELNTLGGSPVERPGLLTRATRMVEESADLQDRLMNMAPDEDEDDIDIVDDSLYYATVVYKHIRSASFLFVAP